MTKIICPLSLAAKKYPKKPALISKRQTISYAALNQIVSCSAQRLQARGVRAGDRVAIVAANSAEYLIALLALWRLGAVACLISPRLPDSAVILKLRKINCRFVLTDSKRSYGKPIWQCTLREIINLKVKSDFSARTGQINLNTPATVVFTSGSAGEPKAALHAYGNHYYNAKGSNQNIKIASGDCWLLSLPLYHVGGLGILFRSLLSGAAIAVAQNPSDLAGALRKFKVTHLSLVATQLYRLLADKTIVRKLKSLKAVLAGGSYIPQSLVKRSLQQKLTLYASYGLTEMASQVSTVLCKKEGPLSKSLLFREFKISKDGEILVRGKTLFLGYVARQKTVLPLTKNGWFRTGDLGQIDAQGKLVVRGRKDNMFISGGENIYPEEIEKVICDYPKVLRSIVLPVRHAEYGFRPVAFVKSQKTISQNTLIKHLEGYLPRFKVPDKFYVWPQDVRRESLKASRPGLRQCLQTKSPALKPLL